jgi:hypothetical protein
MLSGDKHLLYRGVGRFRHGSRNAPRKGILDPTGSNDGRATTTQVRLSMNSFACVLTAIALALVAIPDSTQAQSSTADSTFVTGDCPTRSAGSVKWDDVVTAPEQPARLLAASFPMFPAHLRRDGYAGKVILAMVIDTAGRVMPGTVSIGESTDPALSAWACTIAFNLRFTPALVAGRPVNSTGEQPLSYSAKVIDRRP